MSLKLSDFGRVSMSQVWSKVVTVQVQGGLKTYNSQLKDKSQNIDKSIFELCNPTDAETVEF